MIRKSFIFFLIFFASVIPGVHAHTLVVHGNIGVLLHIDPNDAPVAGQTANFYVGIKDSSGKFNIYECKCVLSIEKNGKELASFPITSNDFHQQIEYSFPSSGIYKVTVAGAPLNQEFQPFRNTFEYYVSGSLIAVKVPETNSVQNNAPPVAAEANPILGYIPYVALIAGLLILAMLVPKRNEQEKAASRISGRHTLLNYSRKGVYILTIIWACLLYVYVSYTIPDEVSAWHQLTHYYALTALFGVFIVLIPGIVKVYFPGFAFNELLIYSRRALGVSAFFFALFHSVIDYFYSLSGSIQSIYYLPDIQRFSFIFSIIALFVMFLMAITSTDKAVAWMGNKKWKTLHRLTYPAAGLIVFHTFMIGSHFINPQALFPSLVISLLLTFVLIEVGATAKIIIKDRVPMKTNKNIGLYARIAVVAVVALFAGFVALTAPPSGNVVQNIPGGMLGMSNGALNGQNAVQTTPGEYTVKGSIVSIDTNAISVLQERSSSENDIRVKGLPPVVWTYSLDNLKGTQISDFSKGDNVTLTLKQNPNSPEGTLSASQFVTLIKITKQ